MITERMANELNKQINAELYSSYLYLSMSAYFENSGYKGFATWMRTQAEEEYAHAMKFYNYMLDVSGRVILEAIDKPKCEWESPLEVFEAAKKHELYVTKLINDLVTVAIEEKDYATNIFLQWFVTEQIEEVSTVTEIIDKFKMIGESKESFYFLDKELGERGSTVE
jgi:ferritin